MGETRVLPFYEDDAVTIYHGDALEVIDGLDGDVHCVLTDPPYARRFGSRSGAMVRSDEWGDEPIFADQMTVAGFIWLMRQTLIRLHRRLVDGGSVLCFTSWKQWSHLTAAVETTDLRIQEMVVWDKQHMGMGHGFRARHELVMHASKGSPNIYDKGTGNVISCPRDRDGLHPAAKPTELVSKLIEVVTEPGDLIVDPFMGSGSTLRAAKDAGRRAVGIEIDERFCEIAARRLRQEVLPLEAS